MSEPASTSGAAEAKERRYAWWVVWILNIALIIAFVDRMIINLMVDPIKADLGVSDTEMSYLMGFAFAIFYSLLGLPIGRLADSRSRRSIIAVCIFLWSIMTAVCGLARNYLHLLLARIGVGVGEAGLQPAGLSLISDYFPKERLATAISVYSMGIYFGAGLSFILGGLLIGFVEQYGDISLPYLGLIAPWQLVFILVALPGIVVSLMMYTIREPERRNLDASVAVEPTPVRETAAYLRANWKTFLLHNLAFSLFAFSNYGMAAWLPSFFIRTHNWTAADIGAYYGPIVLIFGPIGIYLGGRIADALMAKGDRSAKIRIGIYAALALAVCNLIYPVMPTSGLALLVLVPVNVFAAAPFGAAAAAVQEMMPNQMRGQATAAYGLLLNVIGLGFGPTAVALITDHVFADPAKVGYSLMIVTTVSLSLSALCAALALKPYRQSLDYLKSWLQSRSAQG